MRTTALSNTFLFGLLVALLATASAQSEGYDGLTFSTIAGLAGAGSADGTVSQARFFNPTAVAADTHGNVFVADTLNSTIRRITPAGVVTTIAGQAGVSGYVNDTGTNALFCSPRGIAVDAAGNVYVADTGNSEIRMLKLIGTNWVVSSIAGNDFGDGVTGRYLSPVGIAVDSLGVVYVSDAGEHQILRLAFDGEFYSGGAISGVRNNPGFTNGPLRNARFDTPCGIAVDRAGNLFIADTGNSLIRKITFAGTNSMVSTVAGQLQNAGFTDGTGTNALFYSPHGVALDGAGNIYVADTYNFTIRIISAGGVVSTFNGFAGNPGSSDGSGAFARLNFPEGIATDVAGNIYVADTYNNTIRKATPAAGMTTFSGLAGLGSVDGSSTNSRFAYPAGLTATVDGSLFIADTANHTIRKLTHVGGTNWVSTTIAGLSGQAGATDGVGSAARFNFPSGISADTNGTIFVADTENSTIRELQWTGGVWTVTTIAGTPGVPCACNGIGTNAGFYFPGGVAADNFGNVFVADSGNSTIRQLSRTGTGWLVSTIAGVAYENSFADGVGSKARFNSPNGIAVGQNGTVYVADTDNDLIRALTYNEKGWEVTTVSDAFSQDSFLYFYQPLGVAVDGSGNLFVADTFDQLVWQLAPLRDGFGLYYLTAFAGDIDSGTAGSSDGYGSTALFNKPAGITVDNAGNLYVTDMVNNTIRASATFSPGALLSRPALTITPAGSRTVISWPASAPRYGLETKFASAGSTWLPLTNGIVTVGSRRYLTNNTSSGAPMALYRLHQPGSTAP